MLSLNLKTPFAFKTPSMPSGSLGKGSLRKLLSGVGSADLSVTRTRPCALIASISAGIISYTMSVIWTSVKGCYGVKLTRSLEQHIKPMKLLFCEILTASLIEVVRRPLLCIAAEPTISPSRPRSLHRKTG